MKRLSAPVTFSVSAGGDIVSTFDSPEKVRLGRCKLIEEIMIGEDKAGLANWGRGRGMG